MFEEKFLNALLTIAIVFRAFARIALVFSLLILVVDGIGHAGLSRVRSCIDHSRDAVAVRCARDCRHKDDRLTN